MMVETEWEASARTMAERVLMEEQGPACGAQPRSVPTLQEPLVSFGSSLATMAAMQRQLEKALARGFEQDAEIRRLKAELEASQGHARDLETRLQKANLGQLENAIASAIARGIRMPAPSAPQGAEQTEASGGAPTADAACEGGGATAGSTTPPKGAPSLATEGEAGGGDALTCNVPELLRLAARGDEAQLLSLLDSGVDPNSRDDLGLTALHEASKKGHTGIVALLLDRRADANSRSMAPRGETPTHYACKYGHADIVLALLQHKANPLATSGEGQTPLDYAEEKKRLMIQGVLMGYMAAGSSSSGAWP